ncbi:MAG TPA: TIGR00725 family protein [Dehalococcoidia bacterium]|nr:TIGR00725 family protein [Dehalococcoidia bacterium]
MLISVVGGGNPTLEAYKAAEQVGVELAGRGVTVVCGGLGGVMEAVCKGARAAGGHTIGILPGPDPAEANPYVEFPIATGLGYVRNVIVVRAGKAVIAIDGNHGTLSEIAFALTYEIPVVGLDTWELSLGGQVDTRVLRAKNPVDAVEQALAAARARA